ncbi:hypothetical protein [Pontibacter kalidii]|uniref:hypothetical protein n=1 Tax=Pontibacter kalidii TaxID=2592049 RepID=UPI00225528A5|nr:hypothetical protein [Pontibacter kalidii]
MPKNCWQQQHIACAKAEEVTRAEAVAGVKSKTGKLVAACIGYCCAPQQRQFILATTVSAGKKQENGPGNSFRRSYKKLGQER